MYYKSPMENYNKNNPFIIIAKKVYDLIIDDVHEFSKDCIKMFIINSALSIVSIGLMIAGIAMYRLYFLIWCIIVIIYLNICSYFRFKKTMKYFMIDHPTLVEFSRLSELEVNNILSLNNEDLLNCIQGLHSAHGELTAARTYYFFSGSTHYVSLISVVMIITVLVKLFII